MNTALHRPMAAALLVMNLAAASIAPAQSAEPLPAALYRSAYVGAPGTARPAPPRSPRLTPIADGAATPAEAAAIAKYAADGLDGNALRTLARSPDFTEEFFPLFAYAERASTLPPRDREVLILRTAWLTQNSYLWARHATRALALQLDARAVAQADAAKLVARDLFLIGLADELYRNASLTDRTYAQLAQAYGVEGSMDAVVTIAKMIEAGLLFNTLGIRPDAGTPPKLPADIRYVVRVPMREPALATARVMPVPSGTAAGRGPDLAVTRTLRRHPALAAQWYGRAVGGSASGGGSGSGSGDGGALLANRDRELAILRMGWNSQAPYEWAQHVGQVGRARSRGLDPRAIAVGAAAPGWSVKDRAVIMATDELYRDATVSDATWRKLEPLYTPAQRILLIGYASRYLRVSQVLNALGVQTAPEDEALPQFTRAR